MSFSLQDIASPELPAYYLRPDPLADTIKWRGAKVTGAFTTTMRSDLHDYIRSVLETGDHGPYRVIKFEISELNDILEVHSKKIGENLFYSYLCSSFHFLQPTIFMVAYIRSCRRCTCPRKLPYITISVTFRSNAPSRSQRTSKNWWM